MKAALRVLLSRWVVSGLVALQAALVAWFLGPLLTPLEPAWARLLLIGVLALLWLGVNLVLDWRRRRREAALEQGATLIDPESVWFSADTELGRDCTIEPHVVFGRGVKIADGVDATTTRNRHVASTLLCNVRICFLLIYGYSQVSGPLPLPASRDSVAAVDTKRDGNHMSIS